MKELISLYISQMLSYYEDGKLSADEFIMAISKLSDELKDYF